MAKKIIYDKKISDTKSIFRIPVAKPTNWHKDKSKYSRKVKHKKEVFEINDGNC